MPRRRSYVAYPAIRYHWWRSRLLRERKIEGWQAQDAFQPTLAERLDEAARQYLAHSTELGWTLGSVALAFSVNKLTLRRKVERTAVALRMQQRLLGR